MLQITQAWDRAFVLDYDDAIELYEAEREEGIKLIGSLYTRVRTLEIALANERSARADDAQRYEQRLLIAAKQIDAASDALQKVTEIVDRQLNQIREMDRQYADKTMLLNATIEENRALQRQVDQEREQTRGLELQLTRANERIGELNCSLSHISDRVAELEKPDTWKTLRNRFVTVLFRKKK